VTTHSPTKPALSPAVQQWLDNHQPRLMINNEFVEAKSGKVFESINPATEQVIALAAEADKADVDEAVKAARTAVEEGPWSRMSGHDRAKVLRDLADLLDQNSEQIAQLETIDNGTPISSARVLVSMAVQALHFFAGAATNLSGHTVASASDRFNYTLREPVGVVGSIIPWNGPMLAASWKIGPALAAGNTVVLKPAEQTPLSAMRLAELAVEAGVPAGVINILTGFGPGAGSSIAEHPGIDKVSFTGSTEVGRKILEASNRNLKRLTLELGGKSPNIVFPDADLSKALPGSVLAFTFVSGQVCAAGTRLFVQQDFKDEFVSRLTEQTASIKVGDPMDETTTMGPVSCKEQFDRVQDYLAVGRDEGATARAGGAAMGGSGYFVEPTVFDDVTNSMRIAREEIFGPVVSVIGFSDEDDAVFQSNDTQYGLGAAVWTRDLSRAHKIARRIKAGTVWVNTTMAFDPTMPFGGYKQSGYGRELGLDWYQDYTEEKAVFVQL
jgi:acyl-CoA reductase-like NAD-dependent aldehyde dehydrogenase